MADTVQEHDGVSYSGWSEGIAVAGANWANSQRPGEGPNDYPDAAAIGVGYALGMALRPYRRLSSPAGKSIPALQDADAFCRDLTKETPWSEEQLGRLPFKNKELFVTSWQDPWKYMSNKYLQCEQCTEQFSGPPHPRIAPN